MSAQSDCELLQSKYPDLSWDHFEMESRLLMGMERKKIGSPLYWDTLSGFAYGELEMEGAFA